MPFFRWRDRHQVAGRLYQRRGFSFMRLTKEDGAVILGAISVELESQRYRQMRREESSHISYETELLLRKQDAERAEALRTLRDKITRQM